MTRFLGSKRHLWCNAAEKKLIEAAENRFLKKCGKEASSAK
jgi:hypothetical protein